MKSNAKVMGADRVAPWAFLFVVAVSDIGWLFAGSSNDFGMYFVLWHFVFMPAVVAASIVYLLGLICLRRYARVDVINYMTIVAAGMYLARFIWNPLPLFYFRW
jgi:hypothetical protein